MKPAALLMAVGGGVIAVAVGVFVFADQLGLAPKTAPEKPTVTDIAAPTKEAAPDANKETNKASDTEAGKDASKSDVADAPDQPATAQSKDVAETKPADEGEKPAVAPEVDAKVEAPAPSFDVVRVEPNGETLVAGKASPGWVVELKNGDDILAKATADANGDWVMILEKALEQGVSDLSLSATSEDGAKSLASSSNVTVALPENGSGELLVVETAPGQASKVLSKIAAPKVEDKGETPAQPEQQVAAVEPEKVAAPEAPAKSEPEAPEADVKEAAEPAAPVEEAKAPVEEAKPAAQAVKEEPVAEMVKEEAKPAEQPQEEKPVAAANQVVSIEAVEIEGDVLFIAGAAEPAGSIVRLYVDNLAVSDQRSGETGRYLFDGKLKLEAGDHSARVDLLDTKTGTVAKRAEVFFTKKAPEQAEEASQPAVAADAKPADAGSAAPAGTAPAAPQSVKTKKVIIRRGDNLWEIARRVYGAGIRYSTIYDSNSAQIRNPNLIYPGQVFELPEGEDGWEHNFDAVEAPPEGAEEGATDAASAPANGG